MSEMHRFCVTVFKMHGELWFSLRAMQESIRKKLVLLDFLAELQLPSWLAWVSGQRGCPVKIQFCQKNWFTPRTLPFTLRAPTSWTTSSEFALGSTLVDPKTGAPLASPFTSYRVQATILISIQKRTVCECVMNSLTLPAN
jgi:hypothetical protein